MRRLLQVFLVGFALSLYPSIADAQPKKAPDEETKKQLEAMKRFEEAEKLYNIGDFEGALAGYKEAYLLSSNPDLLYNMGQCYRKLGKYDDALITYRSYLREVPNSPVKADVEARIAEVEMEKANPRFSKVIISSNPPGAEVHKGGSTSRIIGTTPFTVEELPAGEHVFTLTIPGFEPYEINLTSEGGKDYVIPEAKLREKKLKPEWAYRLTFSGQTLFARSASAADFTTLIVRASIERFSKDQKASYGIGFGGDIVNNAILDAYLTFWRPLKRRPLWSFGYGVSFGGIGGGDRNVLFLHGTTRFFREGEYRGAIYISPLEVGISLGAPNSVDVHLLAIGYAWGLRKRE